MSSRALRRLRQDQLEALKNEPDESESEEEEEEEEDGKVTSNKRQSNFAMFDDSNSESESSDDDSSGTEEGGEEEEEEEEEDDNSDNKKEVQDKKDDSVNDLPNKKDPNNETETTTEDLDTILNEFQQQYLSSNNNQKSQKENNSEPTLPNILLDNLDIKNLDMEYSMQNLLGGGAEAAAGIALEYNANQQQNNQRKNSKKTFSIFPSPNWYYTNVNPNNQPENNQNPRNQNRNRNRNNRNLRHMRKAPKPPHFMGGGLGTQIQCLVDHVDAKNNETFKDDDTRNNEWRIPFPYSDPSALNVDVSPGQPIHHQQSKPLSHDEDDNTQINPKHIKERPQSYQRQVWYTFHPSETYLQLQNHYNTLMSQMTSYADANVLAMFVADNAFFAPSAYQLSLLFFQTLGNMDKGIEMTKRALCIWEYASTTTQGGGDEIGDNGDNVSGLFPTSKQKSLDSSFMYHALMEKGDNDDSGENACFFMTLFRYMQTSCMVGCFETSLASARLLLSLDPLRDPMGVLLLMDYYALATVNEKNTQFVIDLVESNMIQIHYQDKEMNHYICHLLDMPNWSYHYALALRRRELQQHEEVEGKSDDETSSKFPTTANEALQTAISLHPSILSLLLEKNNTDIRSRSFRTDWPSVLPSLQKYSSMKLAVVSQGYDKVSSIFIQRSHKLWCADDTVSWLYENCQQVVQALEEKQPTPINQDSESKMADVVPSSSSSGTPQDDKRSSPPSFTSCLALDRYYNCNPQDFADRYQMLPGDGQFLDEQLMNLAMEYNPDRRPLLRHQLRRNRQQQQHQLEGEDMELQRMLLEQMQQAAGNGERVVIDPDSPLAEIFLRSMMPWTRVQGVPPRR